MELPVGYLVGRDVAGSGEILNLAVAPEHRRAGLARALLAEGLKLLSSRGAEEVFLEVRSSNTAALELYRAAGFRPVGMRADYYRNPREDALVLRLGTLAGGRLVSGDAYGGTRARRFRKKPVEIEAIRFVYPDTVDACLEFIGDPRQEGEDVADFENSIDIDTLEGLMSARPGDWIIKGVQGEFYPCKPDIFDATYEGPV